MVYVDYIDINSVSIKDIEIIKRKLPINFQSRVSGKLIDSKESLLGRCLLYSFFVKLKKEPVDHLVFKLRKSKKLYIEGELPFNISHTKSRVVLAISTENKTINIGLDIEKKRKFQNLNALLTYFAKPEREAIIASSKSDDMFLKIWTRKEAFYKAIGKGIYHRNSLNKIICLENFIKHSDKHWYLKSFILHKNYICSCVTDVRIKVVTREVKLFEIIEALKHRN